MTLRSKSRKQQSVRWLCAAGLALAAYVVVSRLACGSVSFDLADPRYYRIFVPLLAVAAAFAWETRWDGVEREEEGEKGERVEGLGLKVGQRNASSLSSSSRKDGLDSSLPLPTANGQLPTLPQTHQTLEPSNPQTPYAPLPGEAEYAQAREMPHQEIPDFETDGEYLELLGKAAAAGYARAYAKLGDYAMRRCAWVEAYYWMWRAQKNGMLDLAPILREIRQNWAQDGFPDEAENINDLFAEESGSIGRALLSIASGHDAVVAKAFLKANHPEFLP